ncbi:MAG: Holliday junction branch migration protein RuvA [Moraxella sp.]|nr:Holliday junction branch migration protein RuvA [Moraxella sp.]
MIAMILGEVKQLQLPVACVVTAGGVGYEVELPLSSFCQLQLGDQVSLWTHMMVREDAHSLYGFVEKNDRDAFRKLIKINGVGAKMALAMLSSMTAAKLCECIETGDEATLTRIPGVGKKTAQRLLIELKGKLEEFASDAPLFDRVDAPKVGNDMAILAEVEGALISLGYKDKEAQQAIKHAKADLGDGLDTQTLLKATLKQLAKF